MKKTNDYRNRNMRSVTSVFENRSLDDGDSESHVREANESEYSGDFWTTSRLD